MDTLRNVEIEMFNLFEMTPDLVCLADKAGYFKNVNPAVIHKLGYTKKELFACPISNFIHPEDRESTRLTRKTLLEGVALINFQNRYIAKNGEIVWLQWTSIYSPDKEIVFAIAKDVTEKKLAEKEIEEKYKKFKSLAKHFKSSIEEDRKFLAIELHEELAQLATVVKMDIGYINSNLPDTPGIIKNRVDHAMVVSELLINTIRRISFSISPHMLDEFGLIETMKCHCREFSILNGFPCEFESDLDETAMSHEIKLDFFRISQQALSNVIYHAKASKVKISIHQTKNYFKLCVADNGIGFNLKSVTHSPGLTSMRERVGTINGEISIETKPGKGTKVFVSIPLEMLAENPSVISKMVSLKK